MFKSLERKEALSRQWGTLADNRPILLDAKKRHLVVRKCSLPAKKEPHLRHPFKAIITPFGRVFAVDPSAERWQSG
jgi:hypothetical protein